MFADSIAQVIDSHGKTRALIYKSGISLITSPIPPLSLEEVDISDIKPASLKDVTDFLKRRDLQIISQDGNAEDGIQGVWIEPKEENPGIYYGYIPLKKIPAIKNVPFSTKNDPLRTDNSSELLDYRNNRKIAEILKQYTLFTFANNPDIAPSDMFVVDPIHKWDMSKLNKKFTPDTPVIYNDGKIIVPSEKAKINLISYLGAAMAKDKKGLMAMATATTLDNWYLSITDFRPAARQIIFSNKNGLMRWRNMKVTGAENHTVAQDTDATTLEPYFYRNPNIRKEHLMIIQNVVDGSLEKAIATSHKWLKDRVNIGANPEEADHSISYAVYTRDGATAVEKVVRDTKEMASVIKYSDESYGAILFFI
jgi:hypothetical protein